MRRDQILLHITANLELYRNTELMFPSSSDKLQLEALLRLSARDCFTCRQDVCVCVECVFSLFSCPHGTPFRQLSTSSSPSSEHNHRHCYRHLHSRILSVSLSETDTVAAAGWWRRSCSLRMLWRHRVSMQQEVRISFILARASYDIRTRRGRRGALPYRSALSSAPGTPHPRLSPG